MLTTTNAGGVAGTRNQVIEALKDAWAMDEPAVRRTLSLGAKAAGLSAEDLAAAHVLELNSIENLMSDNSLCAAAA